eukprot:CAMPEP_0204643420 /NCGR_PEP_ID=MMETSP0718-20130828/687_1 /ASSEMBLY_ACC=CAM_ASM_000674 /TAXON_ID=230516 /ORGANISM="Chaetoceros curvisetus" /LENGTH=319 /DNA_ID=CAMNT_0051664617 /DNA_START=33 /DNA_END=995 /DNA_ORIENTATION=-
MPHGWLKHESRIVGRKASRGGSSHGNNNNSSKHRSRQEADAPSRVFRVTKPSKRNNIRCFIEEDYEELDEGYLEQTQLQVQVHEDYRTAKNVFNDEKECPICYEVRPLISLMKKCNHPSACRECLHEIYVSQAQENVSNFPLQCYHPGCSKSILALQLISHDIFNTEEQLQKHYRFSTLAKAYSNDNTRMIVHCPDCDFPKLVTHQEKVNCKRCNTKFGITYTDTYHNKHKKVPTIKHDKNSTIKALEAVRRDDIGYNYGWTKCPRCKVIISKGDGCNHMTCVCGKEFYWDEVIVHGSFKEEFRPKVKMVVAEKTFISY